MEVNGQVRVPSRWEETTGTHWIGAKGRSERCGEEGNMSLISIIDPRFVCRPFLSLIIIPTELSRFTRDLSCWFISTFSTTPFISKRIKPYMGRTREILRDFKRFLCLTSIYEFIKGFLVAYNLQRWAEY